MNNQIAEHLEQALNHLNQALHISVQAVLQDTKLKDPIGRLWEQFLGRFFDAIRTKSRESKVNVLSWISFTKMWRS
jgi:hypothetical protein